MRKLQEMIIRVNEILRVSHSIIWCDMCRQKASVTEKQKGTVELLFSISNIIFSWVDICLIFFYLEGYPPYFVSYNSKW